MTSVSGDASLGAAQRGGEGEGPLRNEETFCLALDERFHVKQVKDLEDASKLADETVQCAQDLGDIFIRLCDRDPDAALEEQRALVSDVLVAFARFYFAGRALLDAVAKELDKNPPALELGYGGDF